MMAFVALLPLVTRYSELSFSELPTDVQALWKERMLLSTWDRLDANERARRAMHQDYALDPATETERNNALNLFAKRTDTQRAILDLEKAPSPAAHDVIAKQKGLTKLRKKAARLEKRFQIARGDVFDEPTEGEALDDDEVTEPVTQVVSGSPFDPLPTSGIAAMFRLVADDKTNLETWQRLAHSARRNGLVAHRVTIGLGSGQSTFDPSGIGEWLVANGKLAKAHVDRTLSNNLPQRSAYLKDLLAP